MLLAFAAAPISQSVAQSEVGQGSNGDGISFRDGNLSVSVGKISRVELLNRIGREAGFKVIVVGDVRPDTRAWSFADLPLRKALKRLLADTNAIVADRFARILCISGQKARTGANERIAGPPPWSHGRLTDHA